MIESRSGLLGSEDLPGEPRARDLKWDGTQCG